MSVTVAISTVADGSMYDRTNHENNDVIENRRRFLEAHDIPMGSAVRVRVDYSSDNYCRYQVVETTSANTGMLKQDIEPADGLATAQKNVALFLPVADCIGAVFYDPEHQALMLSHLGRHSLEQQGALHSVEYMQKQFGSNPSMIEVWMTPAPNKKDYPIWALDNKGMKEVALEQLAEAGILSKNIHDNPADSITDPRYYSYSAFLKGATEEDGDYAIVAMLTD